MRTKTLLIAAAALAVGITSSEAQVYSQNVVGYVNMTVPAGHYQIVGNQLINGSDANQANGDVQACFTSGALGGGELGQDRSHELPDAVVCYTDSTIALPMLAHYALARRGQRKLKRLYDRRPALMSGSRKSISPTTRTRRRSSSRRG